VALYERWGKKDEPGKWRKETSADTNVPAAEFHAKQGLQQLNQGNIVLSLTELRSALKYNPDHVAANGTLGQLYARQGKWKESAGALARVVELAPEDHWPAFALGCVLAELGDLPAYQEHCKMMLTRWGQTADPALAERTAKACLLLPGCVKDPEQLAPLIKTALSAGEKHEAYNWLLFARGLHDYRRGRFDEALAACRQSRERKPSPELGHMDHCVEAMALHRLGKTDEARKSLAAAKQLFDEKAPKVERGDLGFAWHDWLSCQILRREADALIDGKKAEPKK
jgi:serine/threonine-protein kinase